MAEVTQQETGKHHGGHFLIPAGVLIGLGVGMLVGQAGAGVLIGLGLGFIGTALYDYAASPGEGVMHGSGWIPAMIGVFLVLIGLAIVLGPTLPWTTIIAVLIILFGLGFVVRGLGRRK